MLSISPRRQRRAFTLVEAMLALAMTGLAASALLLTVESTLLTGDEAVDRTIAEGMADQLINEILSKRFVAPGTAFNQGISGPNSWETSGPGRSRYDDTDDFHNLSAQPPQDTFGRALGAGNDSGNLRHANFQLPSATLANWRHKVQVTYVNASNLAQNLTGTATSAYRAVEVTVERKEGNVWYPLAVRRRVYAYLPPGT